MPPIKCDLAIYPLLRAEGSAIRFRRPFVNGGDAALPFRFGFAWSLTARAVASSVILVDKAWSHMNIVRFPCFFLLALVCAGVLQAQEAPVPHLLPGSARKPAPDPG